MKHLRQNEQQGLYSWEHVDSCAARNAQPGRNHPEGAGQRGSKGTTFLVLKEGKGSKAAETTNCSIFERRWQKMQMWESVIETRATTPQDKSKSESESSVSMKTKCSWTTCSTNSARNSTWEIAICPLWACQPIWPAAGLLLHLDLSAYQTLTAQNTNIWQNPQFLLEYPSRKSSMNLLHWQFDSCPIDHKSLELINFQWEIQSKFCAATPDCNPQLRSNPDLEMKDSKITHKAKIQSGKNKPEQKTA